MPEDQEEELTSRSDAPVENNRLSLRSYVADEHRKSLTRHGSDEWHLADGEASVLFNLADKDESGTIDKVEFQKLHGLMREEAKAEVQRMHALERKKQRASRRLKVLFVAFGFMFAFLCVSVAANFAIVLNVVDKQVRTSTDAGSLVDKSTGSTLKTGAAHESLKLDSRLPDEAWDELTHIHLTNDNGGMLHAHIEAVSRVPWMHETACEEPLFGSYIRIHLAVGVIWLDGDIMTYEDGMDRVFEEAGFETQPKEDHLPKEMRRSGRRLNGMNELFGWFNSIPEFDAWNSTYDAPPKLPTSFQAEALLVHACVQNATDMCKQLSFTEQQTITLLGERYAKSSISVASDGTRNLHLERHSSIPFLEGWTYEKQEVDGVVHQCQQWTATGEKYHCNDNVSSSAHSFDLPADMFLAAYKGERPAPDPIVAGETAHYFVIKSRTISGMVGEFYLEIASAGDDRVIMHPKFIQVHAGCWAGHSPNARQGNSFGYLYKSFTELAPENTVVSDLIAQVLPEGKSTCPVPTGSSAAALKKAEWADPIQTGYPFVQFNFGPAWSALNTVLSLYPLTTVAQYGDKFNELELAPGGLRLVSHIVNLRVDETAIDAYEAESSTILAKEEEEARAHGEDPESLADGTDVDVDMSGFLEYHEPLSILLSRQPWANTMASQRGLDFLHKFLAWRVRSLNATEAEVDSIEGGNVSWGAGATTLRLFVLPLNQDIMDTFNQEYVNDVTTTNETGARRRLNTPDYGPYTGDGALYAPSDSMTLTNAHGRAMNVPEGWGGGCGQTYMTHIPNTAWLEDLEPVSVSLLQSGPLICEWAISASGQLDWGILYGGLEIGFSFGFGEHGFGGEGCLTLTGGIGFSKGGLTLAELSVYGCIGSDSNECTTCTRYPTASENNYYRSKAAYYERKRRSTKWWKVSKRTGYKRARNAWLSKVGKCLATASAVERFVIGKFGITATLGPCRAGCLSATGEMQWTKFQENTLCNDPPFKISLKIDGCFSFICGTFYGPKQVYPW